MPEIEQPAKTAVPDTAHDQAEPPHASTAAMAPKSQNSAPTPEIEQLGNTAASDTACDHAQTQQVSTLRAALESQNTCIALTPEIEQPIKTVASITTIDHTESLQASTPVMALESQNSTSTPDSTNLLVTEPGYALSCHEDAADKQCWSTHLQRNQPIERALRGLPEIVRLENAAASAFENRDSVVWQQLANLRYQQCKHLPQALQEIQAGHKQTCWAWWAFPSDRTGKSLGAGAVPPGTYCQTPQCHLVKRPRPRGLPD